MTFDYSSETPPRPLVPPPSLLSWVRLRSGQVKLFNFRVRLSDLWQFADAIPQHRPKQHVVCLHHFDQMMKFERNLDGRTRRETTAKGDIAFLPADTPTRLRPATNDPERFLSYSFLVFEPTFLAELALTNGIGRPLDFIPRFASPDPLLHQITAALTSVPRIKDPATNLLIETLVNAAGAHILRNYAEVRYPLSGPPRLTNDQLTAAIDFIHDHIGESLDRVEICPGAPYRTTPRRQIASGRHLAAATLGRPRAAAGGFRSDHAEPICQMRQSGEAGDDRGSGPAAARADR